MKGCRLLKQHEKTAEILAIVMSAERVQAEVYGEMEAEYFDQAFQAGGSNLCC